MTSMPASCNLIAAVGLAIFGSLVIFAADNMPRPVLIGAAGRQDEEPPKLELQISDYPDVVSAYERYRPAPRDR